MILPQPSEETHPWRLTIGCLRKTSMRSSIMDFAYTQRQLGRLTILPVLAISSRKGKNGLNHGVFKPIFCTECDIVSRTQLTPTSDNYPDTESHTIPMRFASQYCGQKKVTTLS